MTPNKKIIGEKGVAGKAFILWLLGAPLARARYWTRNLEPWSHSPEGYRLPIAAELLPPVRRVLDVGCGNGKLAQLVRDRVEHYVGMDHDLARCREATERGAVVQCADIHQAWPYRDRSVEAVACLDVLEHVLDPRHLLREAARVLTPGGVLVLITPNLRYYAWVWDLCCGRVPQTSFDPDGYEGGHLHNFTYAHVRTLLHEAGFPTVTERDMNDWLPPWPWWQRVLRRSWWQRAWPVLLRGLLGLLGRRLQREWMSSSVIVRAQRAVA